MDNLKAVISRKSFAEWLMTRLGLPLSGINIFSSPCSYNAGEGLGIKQSLDPILFSKRQSHQVCISRAKSVEITAFSHPWKALSPKIQLMNMQCLLLSPIETNVVCHTDKVQVLWLDISCISRVFYQLQICITLVLASIINLFFGKLSLL